MAWGRFDDGMLSHAKWKHIERLGARVWADCLAVWMKANEMARKERTDGFITSDEMGRITVLGKRAIACAEALCDAKPAPYVHGLFERREGGYQIHDFADYNETTDETKAKRDAATVRQRRWRRARNGVGDGEVDASTEALVTPLVTHAVTPSVTVVSPRAPAGTRAGVPVPDPDPDEERVTLRDRAASIWAASFRASRSGAEPARDEKSLRELVRLVLANRQPAGLDPERLIAALVDAYWRDPWTRQPSNRASLANLLTRHDSLLASLSPPQSAERGRAFDPSQDTPRTPDEEREQQAWIADGCPRVRRSA